MEALLQQLEAAHAVITARDAEIAARDAEIAAHDAEIAARDAEIAARDAEIAARDAEIAAQKVTMARAKLHSTFGNFKILSELLELLDECKLPEVPPSYYSEYIDVNGDQNRSRVYLAQDVSSVTGSSMAAEALAISKLRLKMTYDTSSKIRLHELDISNNTALETTLCNELFGGDADSFEAFVSGKMMKLEKLQQALYHHFKRFEGARVDELSELQPVAVMFLEDVVKHFHPTCEGYPGQKQLLEGSLFIGNSTESTEKHVSGYTDLLFCADGFSGVENILFLVELKAPNSVLRQSGAFESKDQVIFEAEILGQMTANEQLVLGGLLDMFTIAVVLRKPTGDEAAFYISPRVADTREFIVRILLLLCKDKKAVWDTLLPTSTKEIDQMEDVEGAEEEEEETGQGEGESGRDENKGGAGQGGFGGDENTFQPETSRALFMKEAAAQLKIWRDLDRKEAHENSLRRLFAWDNTRKNLKNLTAAELNTRNQTVPIARGAFF